MKIEVLFSEACNLFGDLGNVHYLQKTLPQAEFIFTPLHGAPAFPTQEIDLIYLGSMTERTQVRAIEKLRPYKAELQRQIARGTAFLCTGNALEIFGEVIEEENGQRIPALGIFPSVARRDRQNRHNSAFLGSFEGMKIMGFRSQFSMSYLQNHTATGLFRVEKGIGLNRDAVFEGVRLNRFFGTYLLGPLLVQNPPFTRYLLRLIGAGDTPLAFELAIDAAYTARLAEFEADAFVAEKVVNDNNLPCLFQKNTKKKSKFSMIEPKGIGGSI